MQFARIAHATGFIYCYPILEANRRSDYSLGPSTPTLTRNQQANARSSSINHSLMGDRVTSELNTFFPFDPYKLPRSSSYIEGVYREWSSVAIGDDEDEDEDEEDEEVPDEADESWVAEGIQISGLKPQDDEASELGQSFGGMSISPMRPASIALVS